MALVYTLLWKVWLQWDWWENPWLPYIPVHNIYPGRGNKYFRHYSSNVVMCWICIEVLYCSYVSSCSFGLIMDMARSNGTDVKRAFTSCHMMQSPLPSLMNLIWSTKCWVFLMWWGECPTNGLRNVIQLLCHPIYDFTPAGHQVPKGMPFCVFWKIP